MKKQLFIFVDRDGTIIYDRKKRPKYYLGHQRNWKSKVRFIAPAVRGLRLLRKELPEAKIYLISNQPGVAIKEFPLLNRRRVHEVFRYMLKKLEGRGVSIDGYEFCGKAPKIYVKNHPEYNFDKELVGNFSCFKPNLGMIKSVLKKEKLKLSQTRIYVVGDRASDVKAAMNVKGTGILVPLKSQKKEKERARKIKSKNKHFVKDFLAAAKFIIKREK